jgi:V8-like Glu-specific endopeptidase
VKPHIAILAFFLVVAVSQHAAGGGRSLYTPAAPDWLQAVGQLTVPGYDIVDGRQRHRDENCSATLVGPETIVTAWHCFEFYRDLSRDPLFTLPHAPVSTPIVARRLADGGGMSADWALLRLQQPVHGVAPVPIRRYSSSLPEGATLALAGYARDSLLGAGGQALTWQADCRQTEPGRIRVGTDCVTYKGASGGAVVVGGHLVGVISAGDSLGVTYFAPSNLFILNLRLHHR